LPERLGLDEEREDTLAVDLDDRQRGPVRRLQLGVAHDVDLLEVPGADAVDDLERRGAEMTALGDEDDDAPPRDRDPASRLPRPHA
jgi:hypothetical protein